MSTIGERLKGERERIGLSQTALGEICQVTKGTQINYEKGERTPDGLYLVAFAAAGGDVMYVLTGQRGAQVAPSLAPDEAALLDNYRNSPPAGRDALKATSAALAQSCSTTKRRAG
jgi:transcriptional regulator with XRE-family HTH domain